MILGLPQGDQNPIDNAIKNGVTDLDSYAPSVAQTAFQTITEWINSGKSDGELESEEPLLAEALTEFEYTRQPGFGTLGPFALVHAKRKQNKHLEVTFTVGLDSAPTAMPAAKPAPAVAPAAAAAAAATPATASPSPTVPTECKASSNGAAPAATQPPSTRPKGSATTEATRILDLILPLVASSLSTDSSAEGSSGQISAADFVNFYKLKQSVEDAKLEIAMSEGNKKARNAAQAKLTAAQAHFDRESNSDVGRAIAALERRLLNVIVPEVTLFQSETYTQAVSSVKDRDSYIRNTYR